LIDRYLYGQVAVHQIKVPYAPGYDFGVGADLASGSPMGKVVNGEPSGPTSAVGATVDFQVQRIQSTSDLEKALGVDAEASLGCGAFGAGISARFSFAQNSKVQTSSLFMSVTARVELDFLSIDEPALSAHAASLVDRPDVFVQRYGNMFVRGIARGGLFVGVLRIDTSSSEESEKVSAALEGTYGLFSASAKSRFEEVQKQFSSEVFVQMYHEGGPVDLAISDPTNPLELLENANKFLESFKSNPDQVARPYFVTLAPLTIADGPLPLNASDIQHGQDILVFCASQRSTLLDQLNLLEYVRANQSKFDFSNGASKETLAKAARNAEADLDLVAACASHAIDDPAGAKLPAEFAKDGDTTFPSAEMPDPMPLAIGVKNVPVPNFAACASWGACLELATRSGVTATQQEAAVEPADFKVLSFTPPAGTMMPEGSPVTVITNPVRFVIDPNLMIEVFKASHHLVRDNP
jgi:hypothetical protein